MDTHEAKNILKRSLQKMRIILSSLHHHQGRVDINYTMQVTGSYTEPLDRQTMERVQISSFKGPVLMNRRNEMGGVRVKRMQYRRWGGNS